MNILFTCGGTAGHVNPAVALAHIFQQRQPGTRVLFVGADGGMETRLVPKEGYRIETVTITNFHRSLAPADIAHNLGTLINMQKSRGQAKAILDEFKPDLVVGTGGYASYPVVNAAAKRGIPTAVHESNAVPGLTTKALSKVVDRVMVGFEESRAHYDDPSKVVVTGTPVRGDFFKYTRQQAREQLGSDRRPAPAAVLLGLAGGGGHEPPDGGLHRPGVLRRRPVAPHPRRRAGLRLDDRGAARKGLKLEGGGIEVREYIYDMPLVMAAADLVLCRAGASTISELTAIAKPSILVPSPNVTANHQEKNARVLADQGAARLLLEKDCVGDTLYTAAESLLRDKPRRDGMVRALNSMAVPDAGEKVL